MHCVEFKLDLNFDNIFENIKPSCCFEMLIFSWCCWIDLKPAFPIRSDAVCMWKRGHCWWSEWCWWCLGVAQTFGHFHHFPLPINFHHFDIDLIRTIYDSTSHMHYRTNLELFLWLTLSDLISISTMMKNWSVFSLPTSRFIFVQITLFCIGPFVSDLNLHCIIMNKWWLLMFYINWWWIRCCVNVFSPFLFLFWSTFAPFWNLNQIISQPHFDCSFQFEDGWIGFDWFWFCTKLMYLNALKSVALVHELLCKKGSIKLCPKDTSKNSKKFAFSQNGPTTLRWTRLCSCKQLQTNNTGQTI